jgi:hypothetical protein
LASPTFTGTVTIPNVNLGAWTTWDTTWTQTATITHTTGVGRYVKIGRLVIATGVFTATSAGTAAGAITCSLPVTAASSALFFTVGGASFYDATGATFVLAPYLTTTSQIRFSHDTSIGDNFGTIPAITVAVGDMISFTVTYESAA